WHEGCHRDRGREEYRAIDLQHAHHDQSQPIVPSRNDLGTLRIGWIVTIAALREILLQHQQDNREEQRKRDVDADDDGAAQITQEYPLDDEHQHAAEDQILQHRMRRDIDEAGAVVIGHHLDARRQRAVMVQIGDHCADAWNDVVGVVSAAHDDDRGGHIVVVVLPYDTQARHVADVAASHVLDQHRHAIGLRQYNILDVGDVVALGQIVSSAAVDEADAANVDRLLAYRHLAPANVDIGVAERTH